MSRIASSSDALWPRRSDRMGLPAGGRLQGRDARACLAVQKLAQDRGLGFAGGCRCGFGHFRSSVFGADGMLALVPRCARGPAGRGISDALVGREVQFRMALVAPFGVCWDFHSHALKRHCQRKVEYFARTPTSYFAAIDFPRFFRVDPRDSTTTSSIQYFPLTMPQDWFGARQDHGPNQLVECTRRARCEPYGNARRRTLGRASHGLQWRALLWAGSLRSIDLAIG